MKMTITEIAIHPETSNPVFGEMVTKVCLADGGGGMFFKIVQDDGTKVHEVGMDFEDLRFLVAAVNVLKEYVETEDD